MPIMFAALLAGSAATGLSQDFFRNLGTSRSSGGIGPVTPSEYSYEDASPSALRPVHPLTPREERDDYNMAVGPLRFSIAAGVGVEFNDNITLSDDDRISDIIIRPLLNLEVAYPMTESNTLRLSLGLSYAKYLDHSEYDTGGLLFSPNSALALTFQAGAIEVTLRDRFSYQEEPYTVAPLSNVGNYRRYENQAGIEINWPINQNFSFSAGYDHYNLWTKDSEFSSQDRAIDTVFMHPAYQLTPGIEVGLFASLSNIDFDTDERQDGGALLVGPTIDVQFNEQVALYAEVGFQSLKFDGESRFDSEFLRGLTDEERSLFRDDSDASNVYFKFELSHKASDVFEHALSASRTAEIGFASDFYDLYHFEYNARFTGIRNFDIGPSLFYEHYETSGRFGESADRWGAAIGIRYSLTNNITLGLDYRYLYKTSDLPNNDYYQNIVFLSAYYRF